MAHVLITENATREQTVIGAGGATSTAITFEFFESNGSDVDVYVDATLQTRVTHYTITPTAGTSGGFAGGTINWVTTKTNVTVTAELSISLSRSSDFPDAGPFNIATLNTQLDKLWSALKQVDARQSRHSGYITTDTVNAATDVDWPLKAARAAKTAGWDSNGKLTAIATEDQTVSVTATGSVTSRLLATRFAEIFNVKDYGAIGDGVTEDQTAINLAGVAASASGGTVFYPPGTYVVNLHETNSDSGTQNLAIEIYNQVHHVGSGVGITTIFLKASADCHVFYQFNATDCGVSHMTIDANRANQTVQNPSTGNDPAGIIIIETAYRVHLHDLYIKNTPDYGIGFEGSMDAQDCLVENIVLENTGADSFDAKNDSNLSARNILHNIRVIDMTVSAGNGTRQACLNPRKGWMLSNIHIEGLDSDNVGVRFNDGISSDPGGIGGDECQLTNFAIYGTPTTTSIGIHADSRHCSYSNGYIQGTHEGILVRAPYQSFSNISIESVTNDGVNTTTVAGFAQAGEKCMFSNIIVRGATDAGFAVNTDQNRFVNCIANDGFRGFFFDSTAPGANNNSVIGGEATGNSNTQIQDQGTDNIITNVYTGAPGAGFQSFTMLSVTSFSGAEVSVTAYYTETQHDVTVTIPQISGTSDTTTFVIGTLPARIRPATQTFDVIRAADNGTSLFGIAIIANTGVITLGAGPSNVAWTASGTKTLYNQSITFGKA